MKCHSDFVASNQESLGLKSVTFLLLLVCVSGIFSTIVSLQHEAHASWKSWKIQKNHFPGTGNVLEFDKIWICPGKNIACE